MAFGYMKYSASKMLQGKRDERIGICSSSDQENFTVDIWGPFFPTLKNQCEDHSMQISNCSTYSKEGTSPSKISF